MPKKVERKFMEYNVFLVNWYNPDRVVCNSVLFEEGCVSFYQDNKGLVCSYPVCNLVKIEQVTHVIQEEK